MKKSSSFKLGCGLIVSLTLGLSACTMDNPFGTRSDDVSQRMMTTPPANMPQDNTSTTKTASRQAAKEPVQATTPGPKRTAAPQIPVIQ